MPRNNWSSPLTTECPGSYCGGVRPEVPVPAGMNAELFLSWCWGNKNLELVYRRDRSLGGREVLVAKNEITIDRKKPNVLDGDDVNSNWGWDRRRKKKNPVEQLPKWWPVSSSGSDQEEYQRMANRLILRFFRDNFPPCGFRSIHPVLTLSFNMVSHLRTGPSLDCCRT
ncbi:hypothetical protein CQW23_32812 [Capsicum baccatum]|uniref:Uncharacterized protein n=1 Tax=Capsicum baccatum TaxID=33114 RepID=A0A2G2V3V1_CAPBA|nr:hypothetical protein CQW23_32812 [Capsicum baccatum]